MLLFGRCAFFALVFVWTSSATAATIDFDRDYFVGFGFSGPPPASVAIHGFDPALGTLQQVTLSANIENSLQFFAQATQQGASLQGVFAPVYEILAPSLSATLLTLAPVQPYDSGPIPLASIREFFADPGTDSDTAVLPAQSQFVSATDVSLPLALAADFGFSSPGIAVRAFYGRGDLQLRVTYEYAPAIPEPATGLLVLSGICAAAVFGCRRRA